LIPLRSGGELPESTNVLRGSIGTVGRNIRSECGYETPIKERRHATRADSDAAIDAMTRLPGQGLLYRSHMGFRLFRGRGQTAGDAVNPSMEA
jgi:hypothetical protein